MSQQHKHTRIKVRPELRLLIAFGLNVSFMLAELLGGYLTGSLALISDAMHMMSDVLALFLALIAIQAGKKAADYFRTYGYVRFEILAAMLNGLILLGVACYVLYEAWLRLAAASEIQPAEMLVIAVIGLVVNLMVMWLLKNSQDENLNVKGAYLEAWADMLGSVGVVMGAVMIWLTGWQAIDLVIAVLIGFMVFPRTWISLKACFNILLQGTPQNIQLRDILSEIGKNENIVSQHNVHLWALTQNHSIFSAHLVCRSGTDADRIRRELTAHLHTQFNIDNITLQTELDDRRGCVVKAVN